MYELAGEKAQLSREYECQSYFTVIFTLIMIGMTLFIISNTYQMLENTKTMITLMNISNSNARQLCKAIQLVDPNITCL